MKDFLGHDLSVGDLVFAALGDPGHRQALGRITGIYKMPGWRAEIDLIDPNGRVIPWVHCSSQHLVFHSADYRDSNITHIASIYGFTKDNT